MIGLSPTPCGDWPCHAPQRWTSLSSRHITLPTEGILAVLNTPQNCTGQEIRKQKGQLSGDPGLLKCSILVTWGCHIIFKNQPLFLCLLRGEAMLFSPLRMHTPAGSHLAPSGLRPQFSSSPIIALCKSVPKLLKSFTMSMKRCVQYIRRFPKLGT